MTFSVAASVVSLFALAVFSSVAGSIFGLTGPTAQISFRTYTHVVGVVVALTGPGTYRPTLCFSPVLIRDARTHCYLKTIQPCLIAHLLPFTGEASPIPLLAIAFTLTQQSTESQEYSLRPDVALPRGNITFSSKLNSAGAPQISQAGFTAPTSPNTRTARNTSPGRLGQRVIHRTCCLP